MRHPALFLLLLLLTPTLPAEPEGPRIDRFYDEWLTAARPLMLEAEVLGFEGLGSDVDRELFIRAFWQARGRGGEGGDGVWDSGPAARWGARFSEVRRRFEQLSGNRAQAFLTAGVPDRIFVYGGCRGVIRPLRIWWYNRWQATELAGEQREGFYLVFTRDYGARDGQFGQWSPEDGIGALSENDAPFSRRTIEQVIQYSRERKCFRTGEDEAKTLRSALTHAIGQTTVDGWVERAAPDPGWLVTFNQELSKRRLKLPTDHVAVGFPGRDGRKTVVLGRVEVPVQAIRRGDAGQLFDRFVLSGEVLLGRHVTDRFEIVYHLAGEAPKTDNVRLDFYRRLRPAKYLMRLRLEDDHGLALMRRDLTLRVPESKDELSETGKRKMTELTKRQIVSLLTFPSVELVPPGESLAGQVDIETVTHGGPIARVDFKLDGEPAGSDGEAPFQTVVDLGDTPALHQVTAIAFSPDGEELARDEIRLDPAEPPFSVRLTSPEKGQLTAGQRLQTAVEAVAKVHVPKGETLKRVELYLDGLLLGYFDQPPFRAELPNPLSPNAKFVRAVAELTGGDRAEAFISVGSQPLESTNVRWVEVFTTVEDSTGRPVVGLKSENFRIFEDREPQEPARFSTVSDLPIQVVLAMDTSVSMRERLSFAVDSARRFFETVLTPKDRAALVTFNHDIRLAVPFTDQVNPLRLGSSGLVPWGGTRLHDTLVYTAGYFGGRTGRRALVLLSDGKDVESDFEFEPAMDQVLKAGVAVYPILLSVADEATRDQLGGLAQSSGGRAFSIRSVSELDRVYDQIEQDLRSQYLLVYPAPEGKGRGTFRRIDVEVDRPGLRTRSIRGYYP